MDLKDHKDASVALVTTIKGNFEGYTKRQFEGAIKVCCLQAMLGYPSRKNFKSMVHANLIAHFPVTPGNISHAYQCFGKNLTAPRGNTVQQKPEQVVTDHVPILRDAIQTNKYETLTADVIFINSLPFIGTYGRGIGLIMAEFKPTQTVTQLTCNLK